MAHLFVILRSLDLAILEHTHHNGSRAMSAGMLSKVVGSRELLAALIAFEGLVVSVERAVMTLEMFLSSETTRAECADECLGGILCQRLLATATAAGWLARLGGSVGSGVSSVTIVGAGLALRTSRRWSLLTFTVAGDVGIGFSEVLELELSI